MPCTIKIAQTVKYFFGFIQYQTVQAAMNQQLVLRNKLQFLNIFDHGNNGCEIDEWT